jgi:hypothetical protein
MVARIGFTQYNPGMNQITPIRSESLIREIEAFCDAHGITPSAFGRRSIGDPALMISLKKKGRELLPRTERRIRAFMAEVAMEAHRKSPIGPFKAAPDA